MVTAVENLYVHFPFCRARCSYCNLYSRANSTAEERTAYVAALSERIAGLDLGAVKTIYFGGGSPAFCELRNLGEMMVEKLGEARGEAVEREWTVELHPLDVNEERLRELKSFGVNRISMGVQALDDEILKAMKRGYTFSEAERAFYLIKEYFDNAGIDLIVGYPGETAALTPRHARLAKWGLRHCSVYSLINDRGLTGVVDDETVMNRLSITAAFLKDIGLERYEISNYAVPGYECRHNLAVWRGEDYVGIGEGAYGRRGRSRTVNEVVKETLSAERDAVERRIFRLRTREGLDAAGYEKWLPSLERFVLEGLLTRKGSVFFLTERGMEVCDTILAELV